MSQARVSRRRFLETGLAMPVTGSLLMERQRRLPRRALRPQPASISAWESALQLTQSAR